MSPAWATVLALIALPLRGAAAVGTDSRGYLTTPTEITKIRRLAEQGKQPYQAAVEAQIAFAEKKLAENYAVPVAYVWENNTSTNEPPWMTRMSTAAYGCALAYRLTQNESYAGSLELHLRRYQDKVMPRFTGWTIRDGQFVGGRLVNEAWPEIYAQRTLAQLEKLRPLTERWAPFTTLTHADPLRLVGEPPTVSPPGGNTMRNAW